MQALGLVFVAVYQKALKLMYVDALLEEVKQVGAPLHTRLLQALTTALCCVRRIEFRGRCVRTLGECTTGTRLFRAACS